MSQTDDGKFNLERIEPLARGESGSYFVSREDMEALDIVGIRELEEALVKRAREMQCAIEISVEMQFGGFLCRWRLEDRDL